MPTGSQHPYHHQQYQHHRNPPQQQFPAAAHHHHHHGPASSANTSAHQGVAPQTRGLQHASASTVSVVNSANAQQQQRLREGQLDVRKGSSLLSSDQNRAYMMDGGPSSSYGTEGNSRQCQEGYYHNATINNHNSYSNNTSYYHNTNNNNNTNNINNTTNNTTSNSNNTIGGGGLPLFPYSNNGGISHGHRGDYNHHRTAAPVGRGSNSSGGPSGFPTHTNHQQFHAHR